VSSGSTNLAQIPIPIIDGPASVHEVKTQGGAGLDNFEVALRRLLRQIDDTAIILDDRNKQLSAKTKSGKENAAARDLAKKTRSWLDAAITDHSSALRRLTTEAQALKLDPKRLATFQSALDDLRARSKSLGGLVVKLDEVIAAENDPSRQEAAVKMKQQLAQAESLLQEDDFEGALRLFDTILRSPNPPADLAAKVKVIRDAWAIRNPAHASARKFAYEEWPKLTTLEQVQAAIPKAREALKTFTDVKDYLSPRRFRRSELPIRNALTEQLRAMTDEEKQAKAEAFKQADTDVQQISDQAKKLIDQGEGGSRAAPEN
jgi:ribosomal protein S21